MKKQFIVYPDTLFVDDLADQFILAEPYLDQDSIHPIIEGKSGQIKHPFHEECEYRDANAYITELTRRMIDAYGDKLNSFNKINLSSRQWTIILCIWLKTTLFDLYYKYSKIVSSNEEQLYTIAPSNYVMEERTAAYIKNGICSQEKNAYIWGFIFEKLGLSVQWKEIAHGTARGVEKSGSIIPKVFRAISHPGRTMDKIVKWVNHDYRIIDNLSFDNRIVLFDTLLPDDIRNHILEKSGSRIGYLNASQFHRESDRIISRYTKDMGKRFSLLTNSFVPKSHFEKIAHEFVVRYIPVPYIEAFQELYTRAKEITVHWQAERIYTVCACVELMDVCNALSAAKGTKLCEIQHSIGYGAYDTYTIEECMYADEFLTWGWCREQFSYLKAEIRPVAITRFPNRLAGNPPKELRILMTCNYAMKSEEGHGWYFGNYLENQMEFLDNISENLRRRLTLRIDPHDPVNMELVKRARKKYPFIKYEDRYEVNFYDSANRSSFIVCDYYSSTHVESLLMGRPFVMFNASEILALNPCWGMEMEKLKQHNIYADTGKEMADILNRQEKLQEWLYTEDKKKIYRNYLRACIGTEKSISEGAGKDIESKWFSEFTS